METAQAAEFFLSDGVVLTGKTTAEATSLKEMQCVKAVSYTHLTLPTNREV